MVHHPAGRLAGVVPALEPGDGDRRSEFADVVELDDPPPPGSAQAVLLIAYVVSLAQWVTGRRVRRAPGIFTADA
jgi:hypothetical protein